MHNETFKHNMAVIASLLPKKLWEHFVTLCMTPRPSEGEAAMANIVVALAHEHNLQVVTRDKYHNVLVRIPATPGYEHIPSLCLQSHLDMVCVKDENVTEMFPVKLNLSDGKLSATGTTLGADNGIGVAAMMTIMSDSTIPHGPLDLLFTTVEETGMTGAEHFDYSLLKSKRILNLDSEEEGIIYVGCAGGGSVVGSLNVESHTPNRNYKTYSIEISGLQGGHSGVDIHLNRGNAIKILVNTLADMADIDYSIVSFDGGTAMNAIPASAKAVVVIYYNDLPKFKNLIPLLSEKIAKLFHAGKLEVSFKEIANDTNTKVWSGEAQQRLLWLLKKLPDGVLSFEPKNDMMVQSSNNVGVVKTDGSYVQVTSMFRSSQREDLQKLGNDINLVFITAEIPATKKSDHLPWEPQFDTKLLGMLMRKYRQMFNVKPEVKTIHAGLEAAMFYKHMNNVEIVSFGPTMCEVHTTKEWVDTGSVTRFYDYLLALLTEK